MTANRYAPSDATALFCLRVEYETGTPNAGRVFRSMASLITAFTSLERVLEHSIGVKGETQILLEEIASGSLRAWLRNGLPGVPENTVNGRSWRKTVGNFLVKGKHRLVRALAEHPAVETREDVRRIQSALEEAARETGVMDLPIYTPPDPERLLRAAAEVSRAVEELGDGDRAEYQSEEGEVSIQSTSGTSTEEIEALLTREVIESTSEMILKIKKPDYLGVSMWDFRHGDHPMSARIEDYDWLRRFQARQVDVRPGDSLRAVVHSEVRYGFQSEIVAKHYVVVEVLEMIPLDQTSQLLLDVPEPDDGE